MIVILAGVTMNALFAWLLFTGLAPKNGKPDRSRHDRRAGRSEELVPAGAEAFRPSGPATRIAGRERASGRLLGRRPGRHRNTPDDGDPARAGRRVASSRPTIHRCARAAAQGLPGAAALRARHRRAGAAGPARPRGPGCELGDTIVAVNGRRSSSGTTCWRSCSGARGRIWPSSWPRGGRHAHGGRAAVRGFHSGPRWPAAQRGRPDRRGGGRPTSGPSRSAWGRPWREGWRATVGASTQIVRTVRGLFSGRISQRELGGPDRHRADGRAERADGPRRRSSAFMALISINLAVLNLLPIPVLDGGQFLFLLGEAVIRRPLPLKLRERLTMVGLVLIVAADGAGVLERHSAAVRGIAEVIPRAGDGQSRALGGRAAWVCPASNPPLSLPQRAVILPCYNGLRHADFASRTGRQ